MNAADAPEALLIPDVAQLGAAARRRLPTRRAGVRLTLECSLQGNIHEFDAQYNFFDDGRLAEVFCRPFKTGSELEEQLDRFCIALSIALQHGAEMAQIARAMGDDTPNAVANVFGAIVRAGAELDHHGPQEPSDASVKVGP